MIDRSNVVITDVHAVLPDRVLADATVVVREGRIAEVLDGRRGGAGVVDGRGAVLIPGLVDSHSDAFEKELRPRPGVELPLDFALGSFEGRAAAAGVTTIYHGVAFEQSDRYERTVDQAAAMCSAIDARAADPVALIDHRVLYRLDVRDPEGLAGLERRLDEVASAPVRGAKPLVSYEDHTPGQGQYTDRTWFEKYVSGTRSVSLDEARRVVDELVDERERRAAHREVAVEVLGRRALEGTITLMAHDPTDESEISRASSAGMSIAEFPTTRVAAVAAKERGMRTVCGAPNALRGTSHSGNVSARELISGGLCDGLASDYLPSTLLGTVAALVRAGLCPLEEAIALVTSGPADTVGLNDRGRIEVGRRADLALVDFGSVMPTVLTVIAQAGRVSYEDEACAV